MNGLLKKDLFVIKNAYKLYLLIIAGLTFMSAFMNNGQAMMIYPSMIFGMLPVSMYALDERDKWNTYALTMPYKRRDLVSEKYVLGIVLMLVCMAINAAVLPVRMMTAALDVKEAIMVYELFGQDIVMPMAAALAVETALHCIAVALLPTAVSLPFMFVLGAEKGRLASPFVIGIVVAIIVAFESDRIIIDNDVQMGNVNMKMALLLVLIAAVLYAVSWVLSSALVKRRDF